MILEQISVILKMFFLGIFIAIMFDNISRYCNFIFSFILWCPIIYIVCKVMIKITNEYEITYIIYYLFIYALAYFVYYKFLKKDLNTTLDKIIIYFKTNKKVKKMIRLMFLVDEIDYVKMRIKFIFKKFKNKKTEKSKKDEKTFDFIK